MKKKPNKKLCLRGGEGTREYGLTDQLLRCFAMHVTDLAVYLNRLFFTIVILNPGTDICQPFRSIMRQKLVNDRDRSKKFQKPLTPSFVKN